MLKSTGTPPLYMLANKCVRDCVPTVDVVLGFGDMSNCIPIYLKSSIELKFGSILAIAPSLV